MAVVAPMPKASVNIVVSVKMGDNRICRSAYAISCRSVCMKNPLRTDTDRRSAMFPRLFRSSANQRSSIQPRRCDLKVAQDASPGNRSHNGLVSRPFGTRYLSLNATQDCVLGYFQVAPAGLICKAKHRSGDGRSGAWLADAIRHGQLVTDEAVLRLARIFSQEHSRREPEWQVLRVDE